MKVSNFYKNTAILVISNVVTGTLNFLFSIILSRSIGPEGMGIYQLVMPLYTMFLFITGGGITVAVSKIAAEKKALGRLRELYKTVNILCIFEFIWSLLVVTILLFISKFISNNIIKDARTYYSILAFLPALIIVSISSVVKGTYYGIQRVIEPAIIDVFEKIVRIAVMFPLLNLVKNISLELSCASAVLALSCGEASSLVLFYIFYSIYKRKHRTFEKTDNSLQLLFNTLKISTPLAFNGIFSTIFSMIIAIIIPLRLQVAGFTHQQSLSMFGKVTGMALNIIFYPAIILNSLSVILIPSISEALVQKDYRTVNRRIYKALDVSALVSLASMIILINFPEKIALTFYKDASIAPMLKFLAFGMPLVYIEIISFSILNALGKQKEIMINSLIISLSDLTILYILLAIPNINIYGYAINFIISAILGIVLSWIIVLSNYEFKFNMLSFIFSHSIAFFITLLLTKFIYIKLSNIYLLIISVYITYIILKE
ncbi:Stage V sporulation protein B [Caloramator mitchellensis]|uniref:Stage V sporulation protein B n=1 Tax=Caloramator mitchellensis TaxID=908809 RepID=A0A0R3JUX0_CALMK|nr:stage V sporulation protein B [Caloramator mitchellensis]KRQ87320.1 Stage V sporulation protein B [Caloramator mitchellensis]